jgi:hypothetical protein
MERELDGLLFNLLFSLVQGCKDTEGVASMTTYKLVEVFCGSSAAYKRGPMVKSSFP